MQFHDLHPVRVRYLGEGYDSTAFEINDRWVVRFPKEADVERQILIEADVLSLLSRTAPLAIPGAPEQRLETLLEEIRTDAVEDFELVHQVAPDAPLDEWHAYIHRGPPSEIRSATCAAVVHNDLAAEHVLVDPATQTVTGVIDWSDVAISNPAIDFAGMFHWGGAAFVEEVLSVYDGHVVESALDVARYMAACRGVGDVVFGLKMNRREYIDAGIRALKLCASA